MDKLPIRKISPTEVALSSYYGKTFVSLDKRKANSEVEYILKNLASLSLEEDTKVKKLAPANVFDPEFPAPFIYSFLASNYRIIQLDSCTLMLDHTTRDTLVEDGELAKYEKSGSRVVGISNKKNPIVVDTENRFWAITSTDTIALGTIYDLAGIDRINAPVEYSFVKVFAREVPVGVYLAYYLGFTKLLKYLKAKYRVVPPRKQKDLKEDEFAISFRDGSYIFSRNERKNALILGGFTVLEKQLKKVDVADLDSKDVYLSLLNARNITSIHFKEMNNTQDFFIDHITLEILKEMGEPQTFNGLLIRATELLLTYYHPKTQDLEYMRFRGYERLAGTAYGAIVEAIRSYRSRNISGKSKIDMSPFEVWNRIIKDESVKIVEDINPIQNLKEKEIVTYTGGGGRSKETMVMGMRAYHTSDIGVISEANIDSGDAGVNSYMAPNPELANLRGLVKKKDPKKKDESILTHGTSSVLSTSGLLAPMVYKDDGKRASFTSVQQSHTIAAQGYHPPQFRTGYEYVIGSRTDAMFCHNARKDGSVKEITKKGIVVQYKDGTTEGFELGVVYGKAEGSIYPHQLVTDLKEGHVFKQGDNIVYNRDFFERDTLDPTNVVLKNSMTVKVALLETPQTHEDSCAISKSLGERLRASTTKMKSIVVDFNQSLHDVITVGQKVEPKTVLLTITDEISSGLGFDEESLSVLRKISNQAPKAGYLGVVSRIEVLYNGELMDMSESLRTLTRKSNSEMAERYKIKGMKGVTGQVTDEYAISGKPLTMNKAEIRIYIDRSTSAGVGD